MSKLILSRDKHLIYIVREANPTRLRYNLKLLRLERPSKYNPGEWTSTSNQYAFFKDIKMVDICCEDEKFLGVIKKTQQLNPLCTSVATFIGRMADGLVYENYALEGIKTECETYRRLYRGYSGNKKVLKKPLEFYPRNVVKFFKEYDITVTVDLEETFTRDFDFMVSLIQSFSNVRFGREEMQQFVSYVLRDYRFSDFKELVKEGYNPKALVEYVVNYLMPFEALESSQALELLKDYWRTAKAMGREVKKYPKYLKSIHDIIASNYKAFREHYDELAFINRGRKELEFIEEDEKYCIILPSCSKDIIREGTDLSHCVGSYVRKIISGDLYIFFLRERETKECSLITLELRGDDLTQAKGAYNRAITQEEERFLRKYCKLKNLNYCIEGRY